MLIPRGTPEGLSCDLFVMVSNFEQDRIDQELTGTCNDAAIYCGVRDRLYPDKKPMGFPFDRPIRDGVDNLSSFLTPNMKSENVTIIFKDRMIERPKFWNLNNNQFNPKLNDLLSKTLP